VSYRALYRQYRPATFNEVIGQEHITTILKNQVKAGMISHAYLFAGSRGTGKTSAAKILARAANCLQPQEGEPCGHCEACLRTAQGNVDIVELDAASNNGVEDVRAILDKVRYTPLELKTKVYIIDEAHALSPNAFNALLKTLEEPPAHILFILATTEPQRIPATIISRCQRMDFHRLTVRDMTARMQDILAQLGATIEDEGLLAIARAAEGGMRDALSLADQCLSFCGNHVAAADVYGVLGSMEDSFLYTMADALLSCDAGQALALLDRVVRDGRDLKVFVHDFALHMRALLLTKLCGGACSDILDCTGDAMRRYEAQAEGAGEVRLLRATELLLQAEGKLKNLSLPRVLIESTLVRIAQPEEKASLYDLAERIEKLEQQLKNGVEAVNPTQKKAAPSIGEAVPWPESPPPAEETASAPPAQAPSSPPGAAAEGPAGLWRQVVHLLEAEDKPLAVMARYAKRFALQDSVLEVGFDSPVFQMALSKPGPFEKLQGFLQQVAPGHALRLTQGGGEDAEQRARALFGDALKIE
jgi:DNA polymerase-3 subunit gamma/tau